MNGHCRRILMLTAVTALWLAVVPAASAQSQDRAEVALKAAIDKEVVDGDLKGAIEQYKKIAQSGNRAAAAKALVRMGQCYEKLGDAEAREARKAYERVLREFADQAEIVTQARERLAAMGASRASARDAMALRQLHLKADPTGAGTRPWNISSDGRLAGATNYATGNSAVIELATGESRDVTAYGNWNDANGYVDQTAISRDGTQLAFWHYKYHATQGNLRAIGTDGKDERVLYRAKELDGKSVEWGMPSDWSPDGKYVVMQLERGRQNSLREGVTDFVLVSTKDGSTRVLKSYEYAQRYRPKILFSPDGRYVAYDYPERKELVQGDIHVVAVDGSSEAVVAAGPAQDTLAAWAPDGSILFISARSGKEALWGVRMDNGRQAGEPEIVRPNFEDAGALGITRTGAFYFWAGRVSRNAYVADFDPVSGRLSTSVSRLTPLFTGANGMPAWSPDGQQLAYLIHRTADGPITIGIRSLDTGKERELLPAVMLRGGAINLKWGADGRSLLALATSDTQNGLYRIDASTGQARFVTKGPLGEIAGEGAEWTADGKWFFTTDDSRRSIVRRNTDTGEEKTIYTASNTVRAFGVSSDGTLLAFVEGKSQPQDALHLRVIPVEGGTPSELFAAPSGQLPWNGHEMAWTPDNKALLFAFAKTVPAEDVEVWRVTLNDKDAKPTGFSFKRFPGPMRFHPDGRRLALTKVELKIEYWVLENFLPATRAAASVAKRGR